MEDPKVFISYSWSDQPHQELVKAWADRLVADGIDVVLDIYDLKEGHDKYAFMERMVTDTSVTHVLVVCDKKYAEKANARKAGVGTESQIISSEVYEKVEQSKFIPIVCEFRDDGEPTLPAFMKSRMWINFSSLEAENENVYTSEIAGAFIHEVCHHTLAREGGDDSYTFRDPVRQCENDSHNAIFGRDSNGWKAQNDPGSILISPPSTTNPATNQMNNQFAVLQTKVGDINHVVYAGGLIPTFTTPPDITWF